MNSPEADPKNASASTASPPVRLLPATAVVFIVIVIAVLAGLLPRWRQSAALAAEHSEMTVMSVSVPGRRRFAAAGGNQAVD
jgi:hypothetical protein